MTVPSASIMRRMKVVRWSAGSTATWRYFIDPLGDGLLEAEVPLIVVPGGPGLPHGYLTSLASLTRPGRPVIFYDPLGCGRSERRHDPLAPWTFSTFVEEFDIVVEHFAQPNGCYVLGHSSGGWIALEALLSGTETRRRIKKLILASVPLDVPAFVAAQKTLIEAFGTRARRHLRRPPPSRGRHVMAYSLHYERFLHTHICRPPWPPELVEAMSRSNRDVYEALWGPSEVHVTGELRGWTCSDRVGVLDMPILLTSGRHDEVTPSVLEQATTLLPSAEWRLFERSAHMPHLEEVEPYIDAVDDFLEAAPNL